MKKVIAYLPAWGFYWLGHLVSKLIHFKILVWLFPLYSTLMTWSLFFNDWGNLDVWLDIDE